jgi:hypothetical protein
MTGVLSEKLPITDVRRTMAHGKADPSARSLAVFISRCNAQLTLGNSLRRKSFLLPGLRKRNAFVLLNRQAICL